MIKARRVRFDWAQTPMHWVPGDPQTTHTMNVLHLLLPAGERWFCDVYREVLPLVTSEPLRADVKGFIGQEAVHARAHAAVLEHLAAHGLDCTPYTRRVDWLFGRVLGDTPFGVRWWPARLGAVLAAPAAGDHRRHRALHCRARRVDHRAVVGARPRRRRPDDARPAALARRRGGGAPGRRVRRVPARERQSSCAGRSRCSARSSP